MKINNTGIFIAILAPVSAQLIRTSDWDQNSRVRLVFGLSEKTERKANPKSEVTKCRMVWMEKRFAAGSAHWPPTDAR